jgi:gamma-glutamylcyclotransferase (GGCT)/AIG2-like uncharacterized protein YtfP
MSRKSPYLFILLCVAFVFLQACQETKEAPAPPPAKLEKKATLPPVKDGMVLHFGYGSNLNEEFMKKYCPNLEFYTTAKLYNYKIYFPYYSTNYKGGLSGILEEPGEIVYGAIYQIPEAEILKLDTLEGVPDNEYKRETFWVEDFNGHKIEADIYRVVDPKQTYEASPSYLDIMIKGAKSRNFPAEYINRFVKMKEEILAKKE